MTGLTADDFVAKNLLNLDINITNCDGSYKDGYYLLTLAKDVGVTRDDNMLTVEFKGNKNYKGDSDNVPVAEAEAPENTIDMEVKNVALGSADSKTVRVVVEDGTPLFNMNSYWTAYYLTEDDAYDITNVRVDSNNEYVLTIGTNDDGAQWSGETIKASDVTIALNATVDGVVYTATAQGK